MTIRPLRIQFVLTSLPVGGAETLLVNLIRQMDRLNFQPEVTCLKEPGELGAVIAEMVPVHSKMLGSKWDASVLWRLCKLFRARQTDAVITVGAGDKMFWGRLAAKIAGVPVICSALHSTGWPDGVGRLNRCLTAITDGFIAVASDHARFMIEQEKFPADRVFMIRNGVDTNRFAPNPACRGWLRRELAVPENSKIVGIIAALRPEKNHMQFVEAANLVLQRHPETHFVIAGDGPERPRIESAVNQRQLNGNFHLLGCRSDTERILAGLDLFCLTSENEANPVSILEALSCGIAVVAPRVGSIHETVLHGETGFLSEPFSVTSTGDHLSHLLSDQTLAARLGANGRSLVQEQWSLQSMVNGYQDLVEQLYNSAADRRAANRWSRQLGLSSHSPQTLPETALTSEVFQICMTSSVTSPESPRSLASQTI